MTTSSESSEQERLDGSESEPTPEAHGEVDLEAASARLELAGQIYNSDRARVLIIGELLKADDATLNRMLHALSGGQAAEPERNAAPVVRSLEFRREVDSGHEFATLDLPLGAGQTLLSVECMDSDSDLRLAINLHPLSTGTLVELRLYDEDGRELPERTIIIRHRAKAQK